MRVRAGARSAVRPRGSPGDDPGARDYEPRVSTLHSRLIAVALATLALLVPSLASALLKIGETPPDFVVHDCDDHAQKLSELRAGKPTLVVFEGKEGGASNKPVLDRLGKLRASDPVYAKTQVVAIADASGYAYWPAKSIAKSILRKEGKKVGIIVWADWSGDGRRSLSADPKRSNLVLFDAKGKVAWASAGALSKEQQDALLDQIAKVSG